MLEWIDRLGLVVVQSEIKPYGPGTRRFILGKHTELPQKVKNNTLFLLGENCFANGVILILPVSLLLYVWLSPIFVAVLLQFLLEF